MGLSLLPTPENAMANTAFLDALDDLKTEFDHVMKAAGRHRLSDPLVELDRTAIWYGYYCAADNIRAAKNFAAAGKNDIADQRLSQLQERFAASAKAYRAGEKQLPRQPEDKSLKLKALQKVDRLAAHFRKPADRLARETTAEAARLETLAAKIAAVRKLGTPK